MRYMLYLTDATLFNITRSLSPLSLLAFHRDHQQSNSNLIKWFHLTQHNKMMLCSMSRDIMNSLHHQVPLCFNGHPVNRSSRQCKTYISDIIRGRLSFSFLWLWHKFNIFIYKPHGNDLVVSWIFMFHCEKNGDACYLFKPVSVIH